MGHIQIQRCLSAPAVVEGKLVGQIALANAPHDYTGRALALVERLALLYALAVQRKRAEDELRQLRNLLSNIVDSMPSVLVGLDAQGRVTQWNREAEKATGLIATQAVGRHFEQAFPELASQRENVRVAIQTKQALTEHKLPRRVESETRYEDFTVYPLITNGVEGAVIRVDNATERVRIEEMMIQSEKMLSVGGLAAGMAHEIDNPLAAILQNLQVMRNRLSGESPRDRAAAEQCGTTIEAIRACGRSTPQSLTCGYRGSAVTPSSFGCTRCTHACDS